MKDSVLIFLFFLALVKFFYMSFTKVIHIFSTKSMYVFSIYHLKFNFAFEVVRFKLKALYLKI